MAGIAGHRTVLAGAVGHYRICRRIAGAAPSSRSTGDDESGQSIDEITVVADRVGLLRDRESDSMFGINRSLVDTPRSISVISEVTMDRYAIETIDDFITTTPGTYGGSFFGVPGAISVRGRRGENYFRGFKRITEQRLLSVAGRREFASRNHSRPDAAFCTARVAWADC
ncbi:MAG: hypothetical protein U5K76_01665 [Woeseiaceae bacterium]|nr:hypothetical protein [Woeseiaceae bacterium]